MALLGLRVKREIGLLVLCLVIQSPLFMWSNILAVFFLGVPAALLTLISGLFVRALVLPRKITYHPSSNDVVLGRPLFFPATVSHVRLSPARIQYENYGLYIGIPVGLRGRIGGVVSLDEPLPANYPGSPAAYPTWERVRSWLSIWFTFDPIPYLLKGDCRSFREKLDVFLTEQNVDPASYPYAYFISIPRFFGYNRNVASWWYLYTPSRELGAVIFEIHNSYNEMRSFYIPVKSDKKGSEVPATAEPDWEKETEKTEEDTESRQVRHVSSTSTGRYYVGSFTKNIFASPFEPVGGRVNIRYADVTQERSWKSGTSLSNVTTTGPSGETRLIARVFCARPPVDPTQISWWQLASFLFFWTAPNISTNFSIFRIAAKIHFGGIMKMMSKPVARPGSIPRYPKDTELHLEHFFRKYLESCVAAYPSALEATYAPPRSISIDPLRMQSPACLLSEEEPERLTIECLEPGLYTRIANNPDAWSALSKELKEKGDEADEGAKPLLTTNVALLQKLIACKTKAPVFGGRTARRPGSLLQYYLNKKRGEGFMDEFILTSELQPAQDLYFSSVASCWAANQFFFGFSVLQRFFVLLAIIGGRMASLNLAERVSTIEQLDGISQTTACGAVYFAVVIILSGILAI